MTDRSLAAKLRDVLSETLTRRVLVEVDARANADDSQHFDDARVVMLRDLLYGSLLPLLGSLQEEQMREVRETLEALINALPDGPNYQWVWDECTGDEQEYVKSVRAKGNALLTRLSPTSAAEGGKK